MRVGPPTADARKPGFAGAYCQLSYFPSGSRGSHTTSAPESELGARPELARGRTIF
jgi:hypothetical protein